MSGLCAPCRVTEHDFCTGNFDLFVGGRSWPAMRYRCICPCCPQAVRGVCDRCGGPCEPDTAAEHRACRAPDAPALTTPTEVPR